MTKQLGANVKPIPVNAEIVLSTRRNDSISERLKPALAAGAAGK
jgi:hypothetical protein